MKLPILTITLLILFTIALYVWGRNIPERQTFQKTAELPYAIEKIWDLTRDIQGQEKWRSDIRSIRILESAKNAEQWEEVPKKGPKMKFRTTKIESPNLWRMDMMETDGFTAFWVGEYEQVDLNKTKIQFTETVEYPSPWMRIFAKIFIDLGETMETYQRDMILELEKRYGK